MRPSHQYSVLGSPRASIKPAFSGLFLFSIVFLVSLGLGLNNGIGCGVGDLWGKQLQIDDIR